MKARNMAMNFNDAENELAMKLFLEGEASIALKRLTPLPQKTVMETVPTGDGWVRERYEYPASEITAITNGPVEWTEPGIQYVFNALAGITPLISTVRSEVRISIDGPASKAEVLLTREDAARFILELRDALAERSEREGLR